MNQNKNTLEPIMDDLAEKLKLSEVKLNDEIIENPICLEIIGDNGSAVCGTLGNIGSVTGKPKSGKTFFITIGIATAINSRVLNVKGSFPKNQNVALYFDTEQSRHHVQKCLKRVLILANIKEQPTNLKTFGLRKYSPHERLQIIEHAINNTKHLGIVIIDGIRDLICNVNSEEEGTMILSKLLKWSEEKNIHIMVVSHENKGDNNSRGHLGSELNNKAEITISIKKDETTDLSWVECRYSRDKPFNSFAFKIDDDGLPVLSTAVKSQTDKSKKEKIVSPANFPDEFHREIINEVYNTETELTYIGLWKKIENVVTAKGFKIGDSKAKIFAKYYYHLQKSIVKKDGLYKKNPLYPV